MEEGTTGSNWKKDSYHISLLCLDTSCKEVIVIPDCAFVLILFYSLRILAGKEATTIIKNVVN